VVKTDYGAIVAASAELAIGVALIGICIGAAIVITIGILVLVFCRNQENFMKVFFISFGVILMLAGLGALTLTIALYVKMNKKAEKKPVEGEEKADVIDAAPVKEPKEEPKKEQPKAPAEEEPKAEEEKPEK